MSVKVSHLTKAYSDSLGERVQKVVDDISFEVKSGEILGFLGPNGAGKSTTMKIITCFIPPTSGTVQVCGYDIERESFLVRRHIGYLPENNPLYMDMYVREYLGFLAALHGLGRNGAKSIQEVIELTGLEPEIHKKIGQLSKGYRQRVGLAQTLLHNPDVLILDEPTAGLDPNQVVEIRNLIKNIGKEKTIILSTHILQEVQAVCSRVIIIHKGRIVVDDTPTSLQNKASNRLLLTVEFNFPVEETLLKRVPGVEDVVHRGGGNYHIYYQAVSDIRPAVFDFAVKNNVRLLNMQQSQHTLEDVFRELTKAE